MIKAFFVDFYGTLVHEDGEVIKKIVDVVCRTGRVENKRDVDVKGAQGLNIRALWLNRFGKDAPEGVECIGSLNEAIELIRNE